MESIESKLNIRNNTQLLGSLQNYCEVHREKYHSTAKKSD